MSVIISFIDNAEGHSTIANKSVRLYLSCLSSLPFSLIIEFLIFSRPERGDIDRLLYRFADPLTIEATYVNGRNERKAEGNKCERNGFILMSSAYASALFYARVERK